MFADMSNSLNVTIDLQHSRRAAIPRAVPKNAAIPTPREMHRTHRLGEGAQLCALFAIGETT